MRETNGNVENPVPDIILSFRFHLQFECRRNTGFTLSAKNLIVIQAGETQ
jgi:hypothetical protein